MSKRWLMLTAAVLFAATRPAGAQIPDKFENLKVLPRDISRDQLVAVMRSFSVGLGVRCQYCHENKPGTTGEALENLDFKADDKAEKKIARVMMRMAGTINDSLLTRLDDRNDPPVRVSCVTCHRGSPVPRTLDAVLVLTAQDEGVDAAIAEYRQLRADALTSGRYNFGENTLGEVARQLLAANKPDDALRIHELNQEFFPASANIDYDIAEIHRARGARALAMERYRKALEKAPNHTRAQRRLEELK